MPEHDAVVWAQSGRTARTFNTSSVRLLPRVTPAKVRCPQSRRTGERAMSSKDAAMSPGVPVDTTRRDIDQRKRRWRAREVTQAHPSTLSDGALALKASAIAGQLAPDIRGWTEISWSNEGIDYWRRGDRLSLPPSEEGGEWRELLSPRRPSCRVREVWWRTPPLPQPASSA